MQLTQKLGPRKEYDEVGPEYTENATQLKESRDGDNKFSAAIFATMLCSYDST